MEKMPADQRLHRNNPKGKRKQGKDMKNNLKRMLAALLALTLSTLCAATAEPAGNITDASPYTVEGRTYPYLRQFTDEEKHPTKDEMTLYFVNGGDIPYVVLSEYMTFFPVC